MSGLSKLRVPGLLVLAVICISCGDVYRPTIIPNPVQPPDPQNFHAVFAANTNGTSNQGSALQVDVSGDSNAGVTKLGITPVHIAVQAGSVGLSSHVWTANPGSDSVSVFLGSGSLTSIGNATTVNLAPGSAPMFVHSTESATMYVADSGNATVTAIATATNAIKATIPVGTTPWAMTETPDGRKLYVLNRDSNSVTSVNTIDLTPSTTIALPAAPQWGVSRSDSARVYILSADGTLSTISSAYTSGQLDQILSQISVGSSASFLEYDAALNRLYIPLNATNQVAIYDATQDPPSRMATIDLTAAPASGGSAPCPGGCTPVSVASLPDGTRAYISSYSIDTASANCMATQVVGQSLQPCIAIQVTVVNEVNNTVSKVIHLPEVAVATPVSAAVDCSNAQAVRFRIFSAAAADSTHVYVSSCDAGGVSSITTANDSYVVTVKSPVSLLNPVQLNPNAPTTAYPPPQNPLFLVAGP